MGQALFGDKVKGQRDLDGIGNPARSVAKERAIAIVFFRLGSREDFARPPRLARLDVRGGELVHAHAEVVHHGQLGRIGKEVVRGGDGAPPRLHRSTVRGMSAAVYRARLRRCLPGRPRPPA